MFFRLAVSMLAMVFLNGEALCAPTPSPDAVKALYLGTDHIYNKAKIAELERILETTEANGIVIDVKGSSVLAPEYVRELAARFRSKGVYTIARIVVFQDSVLARKHPEIAIKKKSYTEEVDGEKNKKPEKEFWYSGRAVWQRYWVDPASPLVQDYNIDIALRAVDAGFDEIQFDYIRFPTDGNMKDIRYPVYDGQQTKGAVMEDFFKKIKSRLKTRNPKVIISIDLFGEVFVYGKEQGIGQHLGDVARYFDVLSPMAYPSHYQCKEFGVQDPTAHPYLVYQKTLAAGLKHLAGKNVIIRPWVQDFSINSIYGCGAPVTYTTERVLDQIRAGADLGINGFMLWNVRSNFSIGVFKKR